MASRMGNFCFVFLILRNRQRIFGKLLKIYVARVVLTIMHVLVFGSPYPVFTGEYKNGNNEQNFRQDSELAAYVENKSNRVTV